MSLSAIIDTMFFMSIKCDKPCLDLLLYTNKRNISLQQTRILINSQLINNEILLSYKRITTENLDSLIFKIKLSQT